MTQQINNQIVVSQFINCKTELAWSALTKHTKMLQWFFEDIPEFKAEVGFKTSFPVISGERTFTHQWEIIEIVPNKKIVYDWRYKEYPGQGTVSFELFEKPDGCKLTLTNWGLESFPQDIPEFARESCRGGWEYFSNQLKYYLENEQ